MKRRVLLDTGPFVRFAIASDPLHESVVATIGRLADEGWDFCYAPQAVREGWNVLTRPPSSGGYGYSAVEAARIMRAIRDPFVFLPDVPQIFEHWQSLADKYGLVGKSVHDANVVATALAHGASHVLTLNERDFRRYVEVQMFVPPVD